MTTDLTVCSVVPTLPPRPSDSNKGNFGRVLVIGGSRGMSGAAMLCASAALRAGAGLVRVASPACVQTIIAVGCRCCTTTALPEDDAGRIDESALPLLEQACEIQEVVAIGPGLDRSAGLTKIVTLLAAKVQAPMVIDADGLNAIIGRTDCLRGAAGPRVITPHPGEFARLTGTTVAAVQANRRELAAGFARDHECIVVLKGQGTIVTDGRRVYTNTTGNPGMATGGTGDVLTGVIAAFLGQGLAPFEAAQLGVYVHGLAGDLARDQIGEVSLIATDLIDFLPPAIRMKNP